MIYLLLVLLICIVIFYSSVYTIQYRCPKLAVRIQHIRASRLPGNKYADKLGLTTINLKLDRDVPCGIYTTDTANGKATLYVSKYNNRQGYLHMIESSDKALNNIALFDLWNVDRVESSNYFVSTYNRGCC